jgi:acyl-homoserine-lactone acylase
MRFIIRGGLALVLVVVLAAGGLIALDRIGRPAPVAPSTFLDRAAQHQVRIRRDEFGVPHIKGRTDADAAFGLAYAHAEDDFATFQQVILATRGQLAAEAGPKAAVTDYLVNLFDVWPTLNAHYAELPPDLRQVVESYADGVNYYVARHPNLAAPGLLPVTGKDIIAGFMFKTPFFYGLDETLGALTKPKTAKAGLPIGSNGVAVAPARSADGATRLLVNSHQPYTGPVAWYEAVVESDEGWHVAGGFFPGAPFMLHGHNAHLGWANTVNKPRLADVYRLTINPANKNQYRLDGAWRDFQRTDAAIRVHLWGPFYWTAHKPVLRSVHGPVLETDHGVFAIRYAGMGEYRQALQYYRLDKAENGEAWRAAMALNALPSINYIYADETGTVGYVYNGQFPNRRPGVDWKAEMPGDRSDLVWNGYLPFDKVPQIWRPKSGLVFNSNNTPFTPLAMGDGLKPENYPAFMAIQSDMTNRAWRALETFAADPRISAEAFRRYKYDIAYSPKSDMADYVRQVLALDAKGDADILTAQALLKTWDFRANVDSRAAAIAILSAEPYVRSKKPGAAPLTVEGTLRAAITSLKTHFGRLDPTWGQVNRIRRGSVDLAIDGGPDTFRAVYGLPQKDGTLTADAGDTLIMFVTWDKTGRLSSESIHQFGSATLDAKSPHYADQTPLFVAMKTKPVYFTEEQLRGHIREDYAPGDTR